MYQLLKKTKMENYVKENRYKSLIYLQIQLYGIHLLLSIVKIKIILDSFLWIDSYADPPTSGLGWFNCRAVSFDKGKTWGGVFDGVNSLPYNGLINFQTAGGFGDMPGVGADNLGNFWYLTTDYTDELNIPILLWSTDKGVTYTVVFTFPTSANTLEYDYPHIVFGVQPGQGYGVWTYGDYFTLEDNLYVVLAFTPISNSGPGTMELLI